MSTRHYFFNVKTKDPVIDRDNLTDSDESICDAMDLLKLRKARAK